MKKNEMILMLRGIISWAESEAIIYGENERLTYFILRIQDAINELDLYGAL
jgi:hypothetical protein